MSIYYQDDNVTLYHGDCAEVLPTLEPVEHIITDPPYSEHVHSSARSRRMQAANDRGGRYGADIRRNVDLGFDHLDPSLRAACAAEFARIATRWVLVFSDVESDHLWRDDLTAAGLDYVRTGAWIKIGSTPQFSGDRPATGFEAITIAHPKGRKRWNGGGKHAVWTFPIVLDRGRTGGVRLHTTQKPQELMHELVAQFTDEGETILDPFAGSGTTLAAARMVGRKSIGIEANERYCEIIARRLDQGVLDLGGIA
ncbi:site-specific DNA-methyltransferase (adenine-specific) [Brevibacterium sanguinis]|uniref:Methyltransferase n=2 Tax=Brevibacterium TaxID=1696 RepID=A0A366INX1_9MICO|nr:MULTISPECIES: site-specific DNA-methyltransferase [Brevibacterium]RBP66387.1 site-specific DNA-methyltransferase (adenine-specific) [Brevibacterium sanguinis]RBP73039.1 site-specific DNA-methyltransferase (adenine-specific) [Brevibacterium celere]